MISPHSCCREGPGAMPPGTIIPPWVYEGSDEAKGSTGRWDVCQVTDPAPTPTLFRVLAGAADFAERVSRIG
jgi:hypothetical protein